MLLNSIILVYKEEMESRGYGDVKDISKLRLSLLLEVKQIKSKSTRLFLSSVNISKLGQVFY